MSKQSKQLVICPGEGRGRRHPGEGRGRRCPDEGRGRRLRRIRPLIGVVVLLAFSLLGCGIGGGQATATSTTATTTTSAATTTATTGGACDWLVEMEQSVLTDNGSMPIPDDISQLGREYALQICGLIVEYARRSVDDPEMASYYDLARSGCTADYDYFVKGKQLADAHHAAGITFGAGASRMLDDYSNIYDHLVSCLRDQQTVERQEIIRKCAPHALQDISGYYECSQNEWLD